VTVTVSLPGLAEVVERLASFDRAVEAQLSSIDARMAGLALTWTGAAASSYADAHARWASDLAAMRAAVHQLGRLAATAHDNYSAAVAANRAMWS
jgi:ESAT-6 family protein